MSIAAPEKKLKLVICGLTVTSSWGNGHATTYRGLMRELSRRGHQVTFLERDAPWYAENRDLPEPPYGRTALYGSLDELKQRHSLEIKEADAVIVGSYVPEGVSIGEWVTRIARGLTLFYDIDTPITVRMLETGVEDYISARLVRRYQLYLSFTGGPLLEKLEKKHGAHKAAALYCSVDPEVHRPVASPRSWDLGYLGTYGLDRQPLLEELLLAPARMLPRSRFAVAGPQYPREIAWSENVDRIEHLSPPEHAAFYCAQRFTLNITRRDMVRAGYSPSVRLFEAAACATPIITDVWPGLESFFRPGEEILIGRSTREVCEYLTELSEEERRALGERARAAVLARHTAAHRAAELERLILGACAGESAAISV